MESTASKPRSWDKLFKTFGKGAEKPDAQSTSEDTIALRPKVSSDDTHKLAAVDTAAVVSESSKVATDDLWAEGYERCKLRDKGLVDKYEKQMKAYTSSAGIAADDRFSPGEIAGLIKAKREERDARRLTFHLRGKNKAIQVQGEKIIKFVLWFNSTISSALASQPYASLAWSGVSIILPLLLNPSKQSQKMMDGLQTISDLMTKCHFREKLFPQESRTELRDASVELYSYIFEYEARSVCHLSRRSARRALSGVLETIDWTGMFEKIDKADKQCASLLAVLNDSKEHGFQDRQAQELTHQTKIFEDFQRKFSETQQYNLEANLMTGLASDYESDMDRVPPRVNGTCEWFFQSERFHRWRDMECSSLLWISAGPGCGKSVLAKTLIDECLLSSASALHTTTCYFFFKEGEERRTKAADALSAILHQLFVQEPQLISNALPSWKGFGDKLSGIFHELWEVLTNTAKDRNAGHIICVLDALDECEEQSMKMLIDNIVAFYNRRSQQSSSVVLKFVVTSRPYSRFRSAFERLQGFNEYAHVDGDECSIEISEEINLVIDDRVPPLIINLATKDRERILSGLKGMKHQTYLWLHLTLDVMDRERGKYSKASKIETLLSGLPVDVSDAYERILSQGDDIESARILLQIIIAADRPLTLAEANVAMALATHCNKPRSLDELDLWPEERFKSTVQDMCGLFVSVHGGKLSLIHQTARGFLIQAVTEESSGISSKNQKWSRCFTIQCAHEVLCSICIDYLKLRGAKYTAASKQRRDHAGWSSRALVLFDYAATKWGFHYKEVRHRKDGLLRDRAIALCKGELGEGSIWYGRYSRHGFAYNGLSMSRIKNKYNANDASAWSAIRRASVLGLADIVEFLLFSESKVDDHGAGYFGMAMLVAIVGNYPKVLQLLCSFNTSAQFQLDLEGSGFNHIAKIPVARIARNSISTEAALPDNAMATVSSALYGAIIIDTSPELIRILLEHGADPNLQDDEGETLLLVTIGRQGAGRGLTRERGLTAELVEQEDRERVRLLLEFGADPNMQSKAGITPLHRASKYKPDSTVVSHLLQAGANVNVASGTGETPIFLAKRELRRWKEIGFRPYAERAAETVQLLRDAGANEDLEEVTNWEEASSEETTSDVAWGSDVADIGWAIV